MEVILSPDSRIPIPLGAGAMAALLIVWAIYEWKTNASEAITVERDAGAAFRLAALLPAAGLLIGLAVTIAVTELFGGG